VRLTQRHLWRSARESIPVQAGVVVEVAEDGLSGFGEAAAFMTDHYASGMDRLHAGLRRIAPLLAGLSPEEPEAVWRSLAAELPDAPFVCAAVDSAVHDLRARLLGVPLWQALGLTRPENLRSSFSIGLAEVPVMVEKLRERPGWSAYKVKLADPGDLTILRALRAHTSAPFSVDGNCGWELSRLLPVLPDLVDLGVELIEQPFPREAWAAARKLKELSPLPVIADESIRDIGDLDACAEAFHGINVKPMKAGGITPTLELLRAARGRGLVTMLGCMPESSAGVSGTAHLGGLVDHLDVDVVDLLAVNTGDGLRLDAEGRVTLPPRPGTGYRPDPDAHGWSVRPVPPARVRPLRHDVLRPDRPAEDCAYPGDEAPEARHLAALRRGDVVGAVSLLPEEVPPGPALPGSPGQAWRLRGMAVAPDARGEGLGTALLRTALTHAALRGAGTVWCRARTSAVGFYRRHGLRAVGEEFEVPGMGPHLFMYGRPSDAQ
jgi:L-Ala-D/L-Glu epimerase